MNVAIADLLGIRLIHLQPQFIQQQQFGAGRHSARSEAGAATIRQCGVFCFAEQFADVNAILPVSLPRARLVLKLGGYFDCYATQAILLVVLGRADVLEGAADAHMA